MQHTDVTHKALMGSISYRVGDKLRRAVSEVTLALLPVTSIALGPSGRITPVRLLVSIAAILVYLLAYATVIQLGGTRPEALAVFPVIVVTWLLGLEIGLLVALGFLPINLVLHSALLSAPWTEWVNSGGATSTASIVGVSGVTGWLQNLVMKERTATTQARKAEWSLRASRAGFNSIVDKTVDGVVVVSAHGAIKFINPAAKRFLGNPENEFADKRFEYALSIDKPSEINIIRSDGTPGTAELRVADTIWDGRPAYIASIRDVTERKQIEESLRQVDAMKSEFIDLISHELRTPLHSIQGFNKLMLEGLVTDLAKQEGYLKIIDRQSGRLGNLIDELLDATRMASGRFEIKKQQVSVATAIRQVLLDCDSLAIPKNLTLVNKVASNLHTVLADSMRIKQVLMNLVSNAIKFSSDGKHVTVLATVEGEHLLIEVIDQGAGIPGNVLPQLFEKFYRAPDSQQGGTGLGLYIARQIVEAHAGTIRAESELGYGSTFSFTLPLDGPQADSTNLQTDDQEA